MTPQKGRRVSTLEIVLTLMVAVAAGCLAGMAWQHQTDQTAAASEASDRQRERAAATSREAHQDNLLTSERAENATENRKRTTHWTAFTADVTRVRQRLEASLATSRQANDGCQQAVASVAETARELVGLLDQSVDVLKDLRATNAKLAEENQQHYESAVAWEQRYRADIPEVVTITGKR